MNNESEKEFNVAYPGKPKSTDRAGRQYDGYLCTGIYYDEKDGTVETWERGCWDTDIYPIITSDPFLP